MKSLSCTFTISVEQSRRFGETSGDRNPIHSDPVVAARSPFGRPIVHGVHTVLAALEAILRSGKVIGAPLAISAQLKQPVFAGEVLVVEWGAAVGGKTRLQVRGGDTAVSTVTLVETGIQPEIRLPAITTPNPLPVSPRVRDLEREEGAEGTFPLPEEQAAHELFPNLTYTLGSGAVRTAMLLSAVIGMEWPGRNSLLSGISLWLGATPIREEVLSFRVSGRQPRFNMTEIEFASPALVGKAQAFFRPLRVALPDFAAVRSKVVRAEFAGHRSLIVGGSRGLGAVSAMLLAAGGGVPTITYVSDREGAHSVVEMIRQEGAVCDVAKLDVRNADDIDGACDGHSFDSLMYFATPQIFRRPKGHFSRARYADFHSVYVDAFRACIAAARRGSGRGLDAFYPSTVAVDAPVPELAEYAKAKQAGEALCAALQREDSSLRIVVERLPRMLTEQTNSIIAAPASNAIDTMLAVLHRVIRQPFGDGPLPRAG